MNRSPTRKSAEELSARLDMSVGDAAAKRTAFWTMLVLSGIIAAAGVATDSTATVIGAMIIAPLSTPIYGVAFGVVTGDVRMAARSLRLVALGALVAIAIGVVMVQVSFNAEAVASSSQVLYRTSPTVGDLLAAVATGLAGSFALMRTDLGDALPGIAVAISLVPPLVVVGVCLGSDNPYQALGAFILFLSNVAALIAACTLVLAVSGYRRATVLSVRSYLAVGAFLIAVAVPIMINTATVVVQARWSTAVRDAANEWVSRIPGAEVESTRWEGRTIVVTMLSPEELPPISALEAEIYDQRVPDGVQISIIHDMGARLE